MRPSARILAACLLLIGAGRGLSAQQVAAVPPPEPTREAITLEAGTGRLLQLLEPAATVMAADPRIARVQPASATTLFVMAVAPGRTTVVATTAEGRSVATYEVTVRPSPIAEAAAAAGGQGLLGGLGAMGAGGTGGAKDRKPPLSPAAVEAAIHRSLVGADQIRVGGTNDALVLTGPVANASVAQGVVALARSFVREEQTVIDNLAVLSSIQVNVRVRVIEISREITRELGINWQALFSSGGFAIGFVTSGVLAPLAGASAATQALTNLASRVTNASLTGAPNRVAASYSSSNLDLNAIIDALAADRLITILAEPNLTAQSGETASFLAGGEFPVPVAAQDNQISIEFKQFGVSLSFVPTVLAPDRLNLHVRPEVSELSDKGSIDLPTIIGTLRIPALAVRRAETTVELGSGQSFAIAGLLQRTSVQDSNGVLGLSEVPVIGPLFKSEGFRRNETELVIIVTPYLVRPLADPAALGTPLDGYRPATDLERILEGRQIARGVAPAQAKLAPIDAGFILD
jgi:pilus assembly protein CpaC